MADLAFMCRTFFWRIFFFENETEIVKGKWVGFDIFFTEFVTLRMFMTLCCLIQMGCLQIWEFLQRPPPAIIKTFSFIFGLVCSLFTIVLFSR